MLAVARARSDGNQFGLYTGCFLNIFSGADFPCWRGPVLVRADNLRRFCHVSALDFGRIDFAVSLLTPGVGTLTSVCPFGPILECGDRREWHHFFSRCGNTIIFPQKLRAASAVNSILF